MFGWSQELSLALVLDGALEHKHWEHSSWVRRGGKQAAVWFMESVCINALLSVIPALSP